MLLNYFNTFIEGSKGFVKVSRWLYRAWRRKGFLEALFTKVS